MAHASVMNDQLGNINARASDRKSLFWFKYLPRSAVQAEEKTAREPRQ
jgi:hypothetical protein